MLVNASRCGMTAASPITASPRSTPQAAVLEWSAHEQTTSHELPTPRGAPAGALQERPDDLGSFFIRRSSLADGVRVSHTDAGRLAALSPGTGLGTFQPAGGARRLCFSSDDRREPYVAERLSTMTSWSILLVDDSDTFRAPIRAALVAKGVRVIEAENGKEGLIRARTERVDLIFSDIHMPIMDGLQMVRELRMLREYATTPIFVLTSDASGTRAAEGKSAGATGWVVKPVSPELLWKIAEKALFGVPVKQAALASLVSGQSGRSGQK